jgi:hypothetical protein
LRRFGGLAVRGEFAVMGLMRADENFLLPQSVGGEMKREAVILGD